MNTSGFYRADDAEIERMTDPILAANIEKEGNQESGSANLSSHLLSIHLPFQHTQS